MATGSDKPVNPFPGLRPFRPEEEYLFFGRESQVDTIVDRLAETHFLAVVGTSGSGKSSLVNCGLEPALRRGLMASAGTNWHIARLRPGIDPIHHLAEALSAPGIIFGNDGPPPGMREQLVNTTLRMSKIGIVDIFRQARLPDTSNLLVIVDQFEELFRYSRLASSAHKVSGDAGAEATAFVNLLLEVRHHLPINVYIVLTMRSDFLGDCAQFEGLPDAIDIGQFLVPRMTREERRAAITGPIHVAGAEISPVLVTRLVNDVSDNPDQLSVLQHALNRTWAYWQNRCNAEGPIDLVHYEAIGTMTQALDAHAERAFNELQAGSEQQICERMFKALTDKATDPRGVRRPTRFNDLCKIAAAPENEILKVIDVFRKPSRSFLMPPVGEEIVPESVIDISHESLMRGWNRLRRWAGEEAQSAELYRRLSDSARLHKKGRAGLLRDPELQVALDWQEKMKPVKAWATQYGGNLDRTTAFLHHSLEKRNLELKAKKVEEHRKERRKQFAALAVFAVTLAIAYSLSLLRKNEAVTVERDIARITAIAESSLQDALTGDPVEASLNALQQLRNISPEHARAVPPLETALWQAHANTRLQTVLAGHTDEVRSVSFSPDGSLVASGSYDGRALIYNSVSSQLLHEIRADEADRTRVLSVSFTPDGKYLATGTWSYINGKRVGRVRLWDTRTGKLSQEFFAGPDAKPAHDGPVRSISFSRSGDRMVTSSYDNTARVWDVKTGELLDTFAKHITDGGYQVDVYDAAFDPTNEERIASVGNDGIVRVWQTNGHDLSHTEMRGHEDRISSVMFSPDGELVLTASDDDTLRLWKWKERTQIGWPVQAHTANIWRAIFDDTGKRLFSGSWDRTLAIWSARTLNELARLRGHQGPVRFLDYDPTQQLLASGSTDMTTRLWSMEPDDIMTRIEGEDAHESKNVLAVRMNPADPTIFASGGEDGTIRFRKLGQRKPRQVLRDSAMNCFPLNWTPQCGVNEIAFSHDGDRIAARYANGTFRLWNPTTGQMIGDARRADPGDSFQAMAAIPETNKIAIGTNRSLVRFYDFDTGSENIEARVDLHKIATGLRSQYPDMQLQYSMNQPNIRSIAYSSNRKYLAIGTLDGKVFIVDNDGLNHKAFAVTKGSAVKSLKFNNEGSVLFAGTEDRILEAWSISAEQPQMVARMEGHTGPILDLDIIDGGKRLVSVSDDETVRIWDTESGNQIVSLPGHSGTVRSVAVVPGLDRMITVSEDDTILIRDAFRNTRGLIDGVCSKLSLKGLGAGQYPKNHQEFASYCASPGRE